MGWVDNQREIIAAGAYRPTFASTGEYALFFDGEPNGEWREYDLTKKQEVIALVEQMCILVRR